MTDKPEELEDRAAKATEESEAPGAPEAEGSSAEEKAQGIADDVRAETGHVHENGSADQA